MVLLLDGDFLIYSVGFIKDNENSISLDKAIKILDSSISKIQYETGAIEYLFYLTGKTSYRKEQVSTYKENRKDAVKPELYTELREYCIDKWNAEVVEPIEADDAVSIAANKLGYDNVIITSKDKDVLQVPCKVHIPGGYHNDYQCTIHDCRENKLWLEKKKSTKLKGYGKIWLYAQMIIGDTVDNIEGLPSWELERIGKDKLAYSLLNEVNESMWYKKVLGKYIDYYNSVDNPNLGLTKFIDNYNQLKLLTTEKYGFTVGTPYKFK